MTREAKMVYNGKVSKDASPIRLAISGKMRSGKDTLSEYLGKRYGFSRFAFADRLKEVAVELFGMSASRKDRHLLVELGRKMCEVDQLVWVNYVLNRIPLRADVTISDVRFRYEHYALKAFDFVTVRVNADEAARRARVEKYGSAVDVALMDDVSERDLDDESFDFTLDGTTYESLYADADRMMAELGRRPLDG